MRFEVDTQKLYISSNWIRQKFNDKGQPFSLVVKELETQKILLDRKRRTVLTGGLKHMPGGQVVCWDVDMSHGLMSQIFIKEVLPFKIKAV